MNDLLQKLQEPFPPAAITWKPGATTKDGAKCMAMAYGDLRTYMERLDEVCGLDWSVRYEPWGNERIIAVVTIAGVTRSSVGEYDKQDEQSNIEGTVAEAQAFKRACAMFGLGRYLYDLPSVWVAFDAGAKKISAEGQAQLDARYKTWYVKAMAAIKAQPASHNAPALAQAAQDGAQDANAPANPFGDATPYYVRDYERLTGAQHDFVQWTALLHDKSEGPCSLKQYQYLTGLLDALTSNQHGYMMDLLCQSEINKDTNRPGVKVAERLFEILPEQIKLKDANGKVVNGDDGKPVMVANASYRKDICEMLGKLAQTTVAEAV